ncbi:unnamed protein product [Symbiodinium natans]|uniref:Uncharacterized protein n=1 Tax=Symbiodinium natans TaxID=878477 RepID=A0A812I285_9DINO|nr:unnamed protein product [Symbiodinium natans]
MSACKFGPAICATMFVVTSGIAPPHAAKHTVHKHLELRGPCCCGEPGARRAAQGFKNSSVRALSRCCVGSTTAAAERAAAMIPHWLCLYSICLAQSSLLLLLFLRDRQSLLRHGGYETGLQAVD